MFSPPEVVYDPLSGALGLLLGAALTLTVVFIRVRASRRLAAQLETLRFILAYEHDAVWRKAQRTFAASIPPATEQDDEQKEAIIQLARKDMDENIEIATFINHFELAAIGIKDRVLSEATYKNYRGNALCRAWDRAQVYIRARRAFKDDPEIGENLEALAKHWSAPRPAISVGAYAGGTGGQRRACSSRVLPPHPS